MSLSRLSSFQCTDIGLLDDSIVEGTEELTIVLMLTDTGLADQVIISPSQATIIIQDNDGTSGTLGHTIYTCKFTANHVYCFAVLDLRIGFVQESLVLSEDSTSSAASVCIEPLEGDIDQFLLFQIRQVGGSADGK